NHPQTTSALPCSLPPTHNSSPTHELSSFYEKDRGCPGVFANRLRTDFYSCSGHTRGVRIPAAPSEDVLEVQRMNELAGFSLQPSQTPGGSSQPWWRWEGGNRGDRFP